MMQLELSLGSRGSRIVTEVGEIGLSSLTSDHGQSNHGCPRVFFFFFFFQSRLGSSAAPLVLPGSDQSCVRLGNQPGLTPNEGFSPHFEFLVLMYLPASLSSSAKHSPSMPTLHFRIPVMHVMFLGHAGLTADRRPTPIAPLWKRCSSSCLPQPSGRCSLA